MKKPRADSVLDSLPENQRAQVEAWLFDEKISYADAAKRLHADFNLSCGTSAFGRFYQRTAQRRMLDRITASRTNANLVVKKFAENQADTYAALMQMVANAAFDASLNGEALDVETLRDLTNLVLKARDQEFKERDITLAEQKYRDLVTEKKEAITRELNKAKISGGITPETMEKIEHELKLL